MPMKNPPHPGEMIGDEIEALGVSISAAAKALGVTRQQLHNLIAGRSGIAPEMAVRLEMSIGGSADTWARFQRTTTSPKSATAPPRSRSRSWRDRKSPKRSRAARIENVMCRQGDQESDDCVSAPNFVAFRRPSLTPAKRQNAERTSRVTKCVAGSVLDAGRGSNAAPNSQASPPGRRSALPRSRNSPSLGASLEAGRCQLRGLAPPEINDSARPALQVAYRGLAVKACRSG